MDWIFNSLRQLLGFGKRCRFNVKSHAPETSAFVIRKTHRTNKPPFRLSSVSSWGQSAINKRQDDWGQKLGSGKIDLAETLMMSNPYTGSVGSEWWRGQAWFMTDLGEWWYALPERRIGGVHVCLAVFVFTGLSGNKWSSCNLNTFFQIPKKKQIWTKKEISCIYRIQ